MTLLHVLYILFKYSITFKNTYYVFSSLITLNHLIIVYISYCRSVIDYGEAEEQNLVFEIDYLHDKDYLGDGIAIAFLDAGYNVMDTISFFDSVFVNNRIIDTYDYWDDTTFVFHKMGHGTIVSSQIIANKPGHASNVEFAKLIKEQMKIDLEFAVENLSMSYSDHTQINGAVARHSLGE